MVSANDEFLVPKLFSDQPLKHDEAAAFQFDAYAKTLAGRSHLSSAARQPTAVGADKEPPRLGTLVFIHSSQRISGKSPVIYQSLGDVCVGWRTLLQSACLSSLL